MRTMIIETTKGPIDDSALAREDVVVDDETLYARDVLYRVPGSPEVVCHVRGYHFQKKPPAEADPAGGVVPIEENGVRGTASVADLKKTLVVDDTAAYFKCAVQYRRPGSDVVIHESAYAAIKQSPATAPGQGRI